MSAFTDRPDPPPGRRSRRLPGRRVVTGIPPPKRTGIAPDDRRGRSSVLRARTSASRRAASRSCPSLITTTCGQQSPSGFLSIFVSTGARVEIQQRGRSDPLRGTPTPHEPTACQRRVSHLSAPPVEVGTATWPCFWSNGAESMHNLSVEHPLNEDDCDWRRNGAKDWTDLGVACCNRTACERIGGVSGVCTTARRCRALLACGFGDCLRAGRQVVGGGWSACRLARCPRATDAGGESRKAADLDGTACLAGRWVDGVCRVVRQQRIRLPSRHCPSPFRDEPAGSSGAYQAHPGPRPDRPAARRHADDRRPLSRQRHPRVPRRSRIACPGCETSMHDRGRRSDGCWGRWNNLGGARVPGAHRARSACRQAARVVSSTAAVLRAGQPALHPARALDRPNGARRPAHARSAGECQRQAHLREVQPADRPNA